MKLRELVCGLKALEVKNFENIEIKDICHDSRKVHEGTLFVCIEGFVVDGHKFIDDAVSKGASAVLVQKMPERCPGVPVILVDDTRYALSYVSDKFFKSPSKKMNIVGVTGTKGKTTTTYMIRSIFDKGQRKSGMIGTIANWIGDKKIEAERTTPESFEIQSMFNEMVENAVDSVVMEVSSQGLMLHRVSCIDFDIGVFTNFSQDHIGPKEHKDMEEYFNEKSKLFSMCKISVVNIDHEYGPRVVEKSTGRVFTFGIHKKADFMAKDIKTSSQDVEFKVVSVWGEFNVRVNIPGMFSVYNALAAISVGLICGFEPETITEALKNVNVPGRLEVVETGRDFTILIDYAHSPDSLRNVLEAVKYYASGRVVSVFGCGGDRDNSKRPIMGKISGELADFTIITSDNPRTEDPNIIVDQIEAGIKETNGKYIKIVDRRQAIKYAIENAAKNDIIILAGKGHETYQEINHKKYDFDEREVVRDILNGKF